MMNEFDTNKDGVTSKQEFVTALQAKGVSADESGKQFDAIGEKHTCTIGKADIVSAIKSGTLKPPSRGQAAAGADSVAGSKIAGGPRFAEPAIEVSVASPGTSIDRALHARLARLTQGISPASVIGAYMDWLVHLAMSPGKQMELLSKARRKSMRLGLAAVHCTDSAIKPCIEPLAQDQRFAAPEWRR